MRLVLDTNALVAAFIAHGACHELFEHVALNHQIVLSKPILNEFRRVLVRKFRFSGSEAGAAVRLLASKAEFVSPLPWAHRVCRDADDDVILATAKAGECDCIVSGDGDLIVLGEYDGIRIVSPADFWRTENAPVKRRRSRRQDTHQHDE